MHSYNALTCVVLFVCVSLCSVDDSDLVDAEVARLVKSQPAANKDDEFLQKYACTNAHTFHLRSV